VEPLDWRQQADAEAASPVFPLQPVDGLEGAVLLNDGQEYLGWRVLHPSDRDHASADIEPANLVDGPQQAGTSRRNAEWCCWLPRAALVDTLRLIVRSLLPSSEEQDGSRSGGPQA
jgi:hypothetical protein